MTYDELIQYLSREKSYPSRGTVLANYKNLIEKVSIEKGYPVGDALNQVVELHEPDEYGRCSLCEIYFPCKTIEVIEKELG